MMVVNLKKCKNSRKYDITSFREKRPLFFIKVYTVRA